MIRFLIPALFGVILSGCFGSKKYKDIRYLSDDVNEPSLNLFVPRKADGSTPVYLFVHGGNWHTGKKEYYNIIGRHFAGKDMIAVLPGYTLSPHANYEDMTSQIAQAIRWTKKNAYKYGGDSTKIFVSGHSAGGHLVALAVMDPKYGINNEVAGIILNDAAGLDMHHYLMENPPTSSHYKVTWTQDPKEWELASPINYIARENPPFMIYLGKKTYTSIKVGHERFLEELNLIRPDVQPMMLNKKHIPMMVQFVNPWSRRYREIKKFVETNVQ